MSSPARRPNRPRGDTYRIRLLGSLAFSLLGVLALLSLPFSLPSPRVGWMAAGTLEPIEIREMNDADAPDAASARTASVPPTRQGAPLPDRAPSPDPNRSSSSDEERATLDGRGKLEALSVAQLTASNRPHIEGGTGALYMAIEYPRAARAQGIEGQLVVGFTVRPSGEATDIEVLRSLHPLCDSAAVRALREVRFVPGRTRAGDPVPVRMTLPVRFQLFPSPAPATAATSSEDTP